MIALTATQRMTLKTFTRIIEIVSTETSCRTICPTDPVNTFTYEAYCEVEAREMHLFKIELAVTYGVEIIINEKVNDEPVVKFAFGWHGDDLRCDTGDFDEFMEMIDLIAFKADYDAQHTYDMTEAQLNHYLDHSS